MYKMGKGGVFKFQLLKNAGRGLLFRSQFLKVLLIAFKQLAEFFNIERQVVFCGVSIGIESLKFFIGMSDSGRLQNRFLNLQPQGFRQFSFSLPIRHCSAPIQIERQVKHFAQSCLGIEL